jgi:hypothetical protein
MKKSLTDRWADFNIEEIVKAAITGKGDPIVIKEAKKLMEETIKARIKE